METKVCRKCGRELPIESFYINKSLKGGRDNCCKECKLAYVKKWQNNKAKEEEVEFSPEINIDTFKLADIEKTVICLAIGTFAKKNPKEIAKVLGISERTLHRKVCEYGLSLSESVRATYPTTTKLKSIMDYQPRELLEALWKKGYDGHFFTYVKHEMTLSKLFGENK